MAKKPNATGVVRAAMAAMAAAAIAGCGDGVTGPVHGSVGMLLVTAPVEVSAIRFRVEGPRIDTVLSDDNLTFMHRADAGVEVIVVGNLTSGQTLARLEVPNRLEAYRITVLEVAGTGAPSYAPPKLKYEHLRSARSRGSSGSCESCASGGRGVVISTERASRRGRWSRT